MGNTNKVFISGKFNVIHPGHIRLFRYGKELAETLHVALDIHGLSQDEIDWRINALKSIELVDQVHTYINDNSNLIANIKPKIILKGRETEKILKES